MILPTMTYSEIAHELDKDFDSLYAYAEKVLKNKKYYRIGMMHSEPVYFKPIYWESRRKNKYVIIPNSEGKSFLRKHGMCFTIFCYYHEKKNYLNAVMVNRHKRYNFYRSHLFDRYGERFLNDTSMSKIELMMQYMKSNTLVSERPFDTATKWEDSIIARVNDGIILGRLLEGYEVFFTFITEDMLKGSEIDYNSCLCKELEEAMNDYDIFMNPIETPNIGSIDQMMHSLAKAG